MGVVPLSFKGNKIWKGGFLIGLGDDVEQPRHFYANEALQLLGALCGTSCCFFGGVFLDALHMEATLGFPWNTNKEHHIVFRGVTFENF